MRLAKLLSALASPCCFRVSFLCLFMQGTALFSQSWNVNADGNWNTAGNWSPATVPNAIGATATFGGVISAPRVITLNTSPTVGELIFNNANSYTISQSAANFLTLNGSPTSITNVNGSHALNIPINALSGALQIQGDPGNTLTFSGEISGPARVQVEGLTESSIIVFSAANSYLGETIIIASTLRLSGAGSLPLGTPLIIGNGAAACTFDMNNISQSVTQLQGEVDGQILLGSGTLTTTSSVSHSCAAAISGSGSLVSQGSGTLTLSGLNTYGGGTTISGTGELAVASANNLGTGDVTFTGGGLNTTATLALPLPIHLEVGGGRFTPSGGTTTTLTGQIDGIGGLTKNGSGILTLSSATNNYSGHTIINTGFLRLSGAGTLPPNTDLTINGGIFDLNNVSQTLRTLVGAVGTSIQLGGSPATTLTTDTTVDSTLASTISGGGALTKNGNGTLTLESAANNYSGHTIINAGILRLSGVGTLPPNTDLTINGGAFDLNDVSQMLRTLVGAVGTSIDLGVSPATALTANSTTSSTLASDISGAGSLVKSGTSILTLSGTNSHSGGIVVQAGTLRISNEANLGTGELSFTGGTLNVTSSISANNPVSLVSTALIDTDDLTQTLLSGSIGGAGGITKQNGTGTLVLSGTNTYAGATTNSAGTLQGNTSSIPGDISNSAALIFAQEEDGTYSHTVSGTGTASKQGAGSLTFNVDSSFTQSSMDVGAGTLVVNTPSFTSDLNILVGASFGGTGTITGAFVSDGTVAPGASIGTTFIVGSYAQSATATLEIEFSPTIADLLAISGVPGTATLAGTLLLIPISSQGYTTHTYTILTATGGLGGTSFNTHELNSSLFSVEVEYLADSVVVHIRFLGIGNGGLSPNAAAVSVCLDRIEEAGFPPGSDLEVVFDEIFAMPSAVFNEALERLQPSALKAFPYTQQTNAFFVQELLSKRIKNFYQLACNRPLPDRSFWTDIAYDFGHQDSRGENVGYTSNTAAIAFGVDSLWEVNGDRPFGGGFGAISYSSLNLLESRGDGDIFSGYLGGYAGWKYRQFDINGSLLGFYGGFWATRKIDFATLSNVLSLSRSADNCHGAGGLDSRIDGGVLFTKGRYSVRPYGRFDYLYLGESGFSESGAQSIDLEVDGENYQMIRPEVGADFNICYESAKASGFVQASLAWAGEIQFGGRGYNAGFEGQPCQFSVQGLKRNRSFIISALTWGNFFSNGRGSFNLQYEGKWAASFYEQTAALQFLF